MTSKMTSSIVRQNKCSHHQHDRQPIDRKLSIVDEHLSDSPIVSSTEHHADLQKQIILGDNSGHEPGLPGQSGIYSEFACGLVHQISQILCNIQPALTVRLKLRGHGIITS